MSSGIEQKFLGDESLITDETDDDYSGHKKQYLLGIRWDYHHPLWESL